MKKVLLASTALVFAGGMAFAEVAVSGSGKMGVSNYDKDADPDSTLDDLGFVSEIQIGFSASGETDGGLSFGGSLDADDSGDFSNSGVSGSVFVEGAFGKLSMGDVDGAAEAAVGDISGVGLDLPGVHETFYIASPGDTPGALYEYSTGDLAFYASAGNPSPSDFDAYAVGVSYGMGNYTVALGYEIADVDLDDSGTLDAGEDDIGHVVVGASAGFGDATLKAVYGQADDIDYEQWGVSLDYVIGATKVTAFYRDDDGSEATGLGVAYDLGGGATLKAGAIDADGFDDTLYDFGVAMSF